MKLVGELEEVKTRLTIKFEEIAKEWLQYKRAMIKESTYYNYLFIINKYLIPKFQKKTLRKLAKFNYNEMFQEMTKTLASKTIKDISNVLKAILKYANQNYKCDIDLERITSPKVENKNLKILNKKEKKRLEKRCLKENSLKSLGVVICLNTGMRIGELCALKWENIDIEGRMIYIKKTLQRVYLGEKGLSKVIIDKPKTRSSIRSIPISNKLYEILAPLKKVYNNEDFFLTGSSDRYLEPRNYQYIYKMQLKKSRVKEYNFHILRHTFASDCIEVGMDPKSLSEILGHANVNITLNRYVHSSIRIKKKFLEKL